MDMDDAEEAGVEPTILEEPSLRATKSCVVHDPVGDDSEMFSSGCSSNMTNAECDADPVPTARTYANDLKLRLARLRTLTSTTACSYKARHLPSSHSEVLNYINSTRPVQLGNHGNSNRQDIVRFCMNIDNMGTHELQLDLDSLINHTFLGNLPQLSSEEYCSLVAPISLEELTLAMRHLHRGSAPGSDGFTIEFYNAFWDVIGPALWEVLNVFTSRHTLPLLFKNSRIILLPKMQEILKDPRNWHPITLLGTDYKMLTIVLTLRLERVMPSPFKS
ncbi:hypothetical protein HPB51_000212 [Rhipicephalus microplus]|uniref:Uncharacterized protein n=1 Tax=Rhipicephalus microplus TaxID=6941 RepID=A0A9J6E5Q9_RHIMP|nr:hypothetical protein HPB51_000212 [Rhipicephalus microplus]